LPPAGPAGPPVEYMRTGRKPFRTSDPLHVVRCTSALTATRSAEDVRSQSTCRRCERRRRRGLY
jgi:hypothetical protein